MNRFFKRESHNEHSDRPSADTKGPRKIDAALLVDLAIEVWRLEERTKRVQSSLGQDDAAMSFSIDKIHHVFKEIGIETRTYTGQPYNEGMSLDVVTYDYPPDEKPSKRIVQETISPAIYFDGTLQKTAQVIVGKAEEVLDGTKHD